MRSLLPGLLSGNIQVASDYADITRRLGKQTHEQTLFVRDCKRFAQFLDTAQPEANPQDLINFARLYNFTGNKPPEATPLITLGKITTTDSNKLLFLSGYSSPQFLLEIGGKFDIDPAFLDAHLSFFKDGATSYNMHSSHHILPSRQQTIFQTTIPSIGYAPEDLRYSTLKKKRDRFTVMMDQYHHDLRMGTGWKPFQSIVRGIEVHDARRFSLEQTVTVLIKRSVGEPQRWLVVIWSDAGAELEKSPRGPWFDSMHGLTNTHFRPVTLPGSAFTLEDHTHLLIPNTPDKPTDLHQSVTMLPHQYGAALDPHLAAADPIYVLVELFEFISASEAQYLDMIRSVLDDNVTSRQAQKHSHEARAILVFSYKRLETRRDRTGATIDFLKTQLKLQSESDTPRVALVLGDFEYLFSKTGQLMSRCDHEWNVIMSEAAVEDAQWSRAQSQSQYKFTLLATFYIPLSFSCSVFGMTFFNLGSLRQGFLTWTYVTIPLVALSMIVLFWDRDYVKELWGRYRRVAPQGDGFLNNNLY